MMYVFAKMISKEKLIYKKVKRRKIKKNSKFLLEIIQTTFVYIIVEIDQKSKIMYTICLINGPTNQLIMLQ